MKNNTPYPWVSFIFFLSLALLYPQPYPALAQGSNHDSLNLLNLSDSTADKARVISITAVLSAAPSGLCIVPVEIDDASGLAGMDMIMRFDPALLVPVKVKNTSLTSGFLIMMGNPSPGIIKVSMARNSGIETGQQGALIFIIFQVSPEAKGGDSSHLIIEQVNLWDENPRSISGISVSDGMLVVEDQLEAHFEQRIPLSPGWNLISFQVLKCFYEGARPSVPHIDKKVIEFVNLGGLAEWLSDNTHSPIRDEADPNFAGDWKRIISFDDKGAHLLDRHLSHDLNSLSYLSFGYGYWIKMNKLGYMIIKGTPATSANCLNLQSGWNLIGSVLPTIGYTQITSAGYTEDIAFKENTRLYKPGSDIYVSGEEIFCYPLDKMVGKVLDGINGQYRCIISFDTYGGARLYDVSLPSYINTLEYIGPKYGYWIKIEDLTGAQLCFPITP